MSWAILLGLLVIAIFAGYAVYLFKFIKHQPNPLNLSDHVGISGVFANGIILVVAIASLIIAYYSYESAKQGGDEQLKALESARKAIITTGTEQKKTLDQSHEALNSVVSSAKVQQQLLTKSLQASQTQLTIIQEQRKRELDRPNIYAKFINPLSLEVSIINISKNKVASDVHYELILVNLDRLNNESGYFELYSKRRNISPIAPGTEFLPESLECSGPVPNKGDRLFGYLTLGCRECETQRFYWLFYKYGETGWYHEGTVSDYPYPIFQYKVSSNMTDILKTFKSHSNLHVITDVN